MTAIIIDDEPLARMMVKEYLNAYPQVTILQECGDGFEGLKAIRQHQPDILFLDIQMPKINGFEMLELVEVPPRVIFTTAFDSFAIRAFELHAVDYLLKPFNQERFNQAMKKALAATASAKPAIEAVLESVSRDASPATRIVVKDGGKIRIVPLGRVHYLEAADDYIRIHSSDGVFLKKKTMQYFEDSLDPAQFARVHRSYLVNLSLITRIEPYEKDGHLALLSTGARLPVSKQGYGKLKELLGI